jgi:hypothetical protein
LVVLIDLLNRGILCIVLLLWSIILLLLLLLWSILIEIILSGLIEIILGRLVEIILTLGLLVEILNWTSESLWLLLIIILRRNLLLLLLKLLERLLIHLLLLLDLLRTMLLLSYLGYFFDAFVSWLNRDLSLSLLILTSILNIFVVFYGFTYLRAVFMNYLKVIQNKTIWFLFSFSPNNS